MATHPSTANSRLAGLKVAAFGLVYLTIFFALSSSIVATLSILNESRLPIADKLANWLFTGSLLSFSIYGVLDLRVPDLRLPIAGAIWATVINGALILFIMTSKF